MSAISFPSLAVPVPSLTHSHEQEGHWLEWRQGTVGFGYTARRWLPTLSHRNQCPSQQWQILPVPGTLSKLLDADASRQVRGPDMQALGEGVRVAGEVDVWGDVWRMVGG